MNSVLIFSDSFKLEKMFKDTSFNVKTTSLKYELARLIIEKEDIKLLIIDMPVNTEEYLKFYSSLAKSFPLLKVIAISDNIIPGIPSAFTQIRNTEVSEKLLGFLNTVKTENPPSDRREYNRFDWPLKGKLSEAGRNWHTYNVRLISAGGAFLESNKPPPRAGKEYLIRIDFQDFRVLTNCEILSPRNASSNLPAGFGVKFTDLTAVSAEFMDRIIEDALIHALIEPDSEPAIPSIGEEELLTASFDIL
ncbi:MAG: PilZ domain-containing protein [Spirochaetales bacterium]|nr:PilZ domain-containing protein [Spirochaetales bacterium]